MAEGIGGIEGGSADIGLRPVFAEPGGEAGDAERGVFLQREPAAHQQGVAAALLRVSGV